MIAAPQEVGNGCPEVLTTCVSVAQGAGWYAQARLPRGRRWSRRGNGPGSLNATYLAIDRATPMRGGGAVLEHLRDAHYSGAKSLGHGEGANSMRMIIRTMLRRSITYLTAWKARALLRASGKRAMRRCSRGGLA